MTAPSSCGGSCGFRADSRVLMRAGLMSASTVWRSSAMLEGRPPMPAARWTATTAWWVCAHNGTTEASLSVVSTSSVASRSFCRSFTRTVSCSPSFASCDTRENWAASPSESYPRTPPKTSPISSAATITANSRRATGQSNGFSGRRLAELTEFDETVFLRGVKPRTLVLAAPWVPICQCPRWKANLLRAAVSTDGPDATRSRSRRHTAPATSFGRCLSNSRAAFGEISVLYRLVIIELPFAARRAALLAGGAPLDWGHDTAQRADQPPPERVPHRSLHPARRGAAGTRHGDGRAVRER